jgi:DNA repair exonuclease SbcCD ATPase subunit
MSAEAIDPMMPRLNLPEFGDWGTNRSGNDTQRPDPSAASFPFSLQAPSLEIPELGTPQEAVFVPEPIQSEPAAASETIGSISDAQSPELTLDERDEMHSQLRQDILGTVARHEQITTDRYDLNVKHLEELLPRMKRENGECKFASEQARQELTNRLEVVWTQVQSTKQQLRAEVIDTSKALDKFARLDDEVNRLQGYYAMKVDEANTHNRQIASLDATKQQHLSKKIEFITARDFAANDQSLFEEKYQPYVVEHANPDWTGPMPTAGTPTHLLRSYAVSAIERKIIPDLEADRAKLVDQQTAASDTALQVNAILQTAKQNRAEASALYADAQHRLQTINTRLQQLEAQLAQLQREAHELKYPDEQTMIEKMAEQVQREREERRRHELLATTKSVSVTSSNIELVGGNTFVVSRTANKRPSTVLDGDASTRRAVKAAQQKSIGARLVAAFRRS